MSGRRAGTGAALAAAMAFGLLGLGGCTQALSWLVAQFTPPKRVPAVYKPPPNKKVLVFVDDRKFPISYEPLKYELAERTAAKLIEHKVVRAAVRYELLEDLSIASDFNRLPISQVGQKLGADLVLYVQIEGFSLKDEAESPMWRGRLDVQVWFVDAKSPGRLWPKEMTQFTGYPVEPVALKEEENPSAIYGEQVAKAVAEEMADRIAKLFYDHYQKADRYHDEGPKSTSFD